MRMATHIVATDKQMMLQARFAPDCDCGLVKWGETPGGGFKPGPWRSCSNVAIVAYDTDAYGGYGESKAKGAGKPWGNSGQMMGLLSTEAEIEQSTS